MKYTLIISAAAHLVLIATIIVPAYQGRSTDMSEVISVSLLGGGGAAVAAAPPPPAKSEAVQAEKQPEPEPAKTSNSKMAYKTTKDDKKKPKPTADKSKGKSSAKTSGKTASGSAGGKGTGSGTGSGAGNGPGSGNITVDNQDFRFAYYLEVLRERISYNWSPPPVFGSSGQVTATVFFRISRNGTISEEKVERASKHEMFDRAALRAVKISDPLPPLPAGFKGKYLGVHFEFEQSPG